MSLEHDLRHALRRESPPSGFASRVMQRIDQQERTRRRPWRTVAASFVLMSVLGGSAAYVIHERRQAEGERAREQVLLALRIAGEKVRYAQHEVRDISD
jgi:hypothetical protein